jgi:hypothetical protein
MRPLFVQMLLVARSRRMCCSRVASVSTKPGWPFLSTVSPTMRPGHLLEIFAIVAAGEEAHARAAELGRQAERLPSADRDVHAEAPGGSSSRARRARASR